MQLPSSKTSIKTVVFGAMAVAAALVTGVAQAALQDRDLNGDSVVDAFYDTDLNITWLRNANVNGQMNWPTAAAWADGLSFAGYDDWRLPTSDFCQGVNCTGSEMGHLWYVELGNLAGGPMANTGGFVNVQNAEIGSIYWSGTDHMSNPAAAYAFRFWNGVQIANIKVSRPDFFAMAVRDGDVPAIPEPQTVMLMLAGWTALALVRRHQSR